jgi:hypothetical protein
MEKQSRRRGRASGCATPGEDTRLAGMPRVAFLAACLFTAGAVAARAQTPALDEARLQALQQQVEIARSQALEAERAINAVQAQLRTEQTLRRLEADRQASAPPPLPQPYSPTTPYALGLGTDAAARGAAQAGPLDSRHAADSDRLLQLQAQAMARSNARILAVRPAL